MRLNSFGVGCSTLAFLFAFAAGPQQLSPARAETPPAPAPPPAPPLSPQQIALLREALEQAPAQGLAVGEFLPSGLEALLSSGDAERRARGEALLKTAVLRYAKAVHSGRLAADDFPDDWGIRPAAFDPAPGLEGALAQNALPQWLASLPPQHPEYRQLVKQLAFYRAIAERGGWRPLAKGKTLKAGMSDRRVPDLRARLAIEDPLVPASGTNPEAMDQGLTEAVKAFQRRHGLIDDGEVGRPTLAALNTPVEARIAQIEANMERLRWLPEALPSDRVEVNVPAAMTILYKDGKPVLVMKAAPGKKGDETPMLQSVIDGVVLNPPWNIPKSIAEKEIWPKERANPGYMQAEEIRVIRTADGGERLQQKAGPKSALGQVKFEFDNRYGVYLHDTPNKAAFDRQTRTVSHGCVRLEKPRELAEALLQGQPAWTPEAVTLAIDTGETQRVGLAKPEAVFLLYYTAFVGSDGQMRFLKDPYGWDAELMKKVAPKA